MRSRDWGLVISGGAALAAAVFAVGGAFRWVQALVAVLVAGALASQLSSRRVLARASPLQFCIAAAAGLTALSLIPLPAGIRGWLDPIGSEFRDDGSSLLDLSPWPGLTRDAPGSLRALIYFAILLGVATIALRWAPSERGRYRLQTAVAAVCVVAALVTGLHELLGATELYGLYEAHAHPRVLGPLLNENHFGNLMAIGTCVSLGLAFYRRQPTWLRVTWVAAVAICGGATAASYSRGALLGLLVGGALTAAALLGQRFTSVDSHKRRMRFAVSSLPIGVVAACVVVIVVYSSAGGVSAKLSATTSAEIDQPRSKFAAWKSSETLIQESPWVGVGRGGLESSFTRVHPASGQVTFAYLENEYIEAVVDWGVPGALALGVLMLWCFGVATRRWRDGPLAAAALGALAATAVQSTVDFGIELLGVAVPLVVITATVTYVPLREGTGRTLTAARGLRLVQITTLVVGAVLLFADSTTSVGEDHDRLRHNPSLAAVSADLTRHPLDYYGYALASQLTRQAGDDRSTRLLNHAMRLHPTEPDLHRIAGSLLLASGHVEQATIEYAAALRASPDPARLLAEVTKIFAPADAAKAIPTDYPNLDLILGELRELRHEDVSMLWLSRVLEMHPTDIHTCNLLYELAVSRADVKAAIVAGRSCVELMPDQQTRLSLAGLLLQNHDFTEVIRLLEDVENWTGLIEDKAKAWLILCDARVGLGDWDRATACLHRLDASGALQGKHEEITKRLLTVQDNRVRATETNLGSGQH